MSSVQEGPALLLLSTAFERAATALIFRLGTFVEAGWLEDAAGLLECEQIYSLSIALVLILFFA